MQRSRPILHPPASVLHATLAWTVGLAGLSACSLEQPRSPRFETDVFIPLGHERASGQDLIDGSEYLEGDSTGLAPLRLRLEGDVPPFRVGSLLDLDLPAGSLEARLESITLHPPAPIEARFSLADLTGVSLPTETPVVVPAFAFESVSRDLPPQETFTWLRLSGGAVEVTLTNTLPVPLGGDGDGQLALELKNRSDGSTILDTSVAGSLLPNATRSVRLPLAGITIESELDLEVRGESEGSGGSSVVLRAGDGLAVEVAFMDVAADSAIARVPAQRFEVDGSLALSNDSSIEIQNADVLDGRLVFTVTNPYPLGAALTLTWPALTREGVPVRTDAAVSASATSSLELDLAGAELALAAPARTITYHLSLLTEGSDGAFVALGTTRRARLTSQPARLRFKSLEGRLLERRVDIPSNEVRVEPPEGLDRFGFEAAELALEVENGIPLPARADLVLEGIPESGARVRVPLVFPIAASTEQGPTTTVFRINETLPGLLDLIHKPLEALSLSGSLRAGTGGETARVRRDDEVRARYTLTAPLRARIGETRHRSEPFRFKVDADVQERIREELVEASAEGSIENHFPAGVDARLSFATTPGGLDSAEVTLDPIGVDLPQIDATGRVDAPSIRSFRLDIDPADLSFFARDEVWGRVILDVRGDSARAVEITARDYVQVSGILRFRIRVGS